jgi:hypothetical protein
MSVREPLHRSAAMVVVYWVVGVDCCVALGDEAVDAGVSSRV